MRRALLLLAILSSLAGACVNHSTEHRVRANAFFRDGRYAEALKECDLGLSAKPDDVGTLILRAKALFELDRLGESKESFTRAVSLGEGHDRTYMGDAYLGLAIVASREKDWREARLEFEKLLELDPNDVGTRTNLARVCLELGDLPKAEEHAEAAVALRGQDEAALFVLGRVLLAEGKLDDASLAFARISAVNAKAPSAPYGQAMVLAKKGDKPGAIAKLGEAVALHVPNPQEILVDPAFAAMKDDPEFQKVAASAVK